MKRSPSSASTARSASACRPSAPSRPHPKARPWHDQLQHGARRAGPADRSDGKGPPSRLSPPATGDGAGPAVTRASLQADLLAAHERALRLTARVRQLEHRLSEALGEQAWRESGLGTPADIDALEQKITHLEQQAIDLRLQLEQRDEDLTAARAANREFMAQLNTTAHRR